jgi:hypothetical protein
MEVDTRSGTNEASDVYCSRTFRLLGGGGSAMILAETYGHVDMGAGPLSLEYLYCGVFWRALEHDVNDGLGLAIMMLSDEYILPGTCRHRAGHN